jgi:predicted nucleic acid-binding protein
VGTRRNCRVEPAGLPRGTSGRSRGPSPGQDHPTVLRRAVERIDELCTEVDVIGLDPALAHWAGDLAEAHGLRGDEAVHLAPALSVEADSLLLATWDGDLARAAVAAGCSVSPPPALR